MQQKITRRPIVGVMGSGKEEHRTLALPLGRWLATQAVHLLNGGGSGVMETVASAFASVPTRLGSIIGILPGDDAGTPPIGYPNPWIEVVIQTHLPLSGAEGTDVLSRNHLNVLSSNIIVALPGGPGTSSELALAVKYGRPAIAYLGPNGTIPDIPQSVPVGRTLSDVEDFLRPRLIEIRKRIGIAERNGDR